MNMSKLEVLFIKESRYRVLGAILTRILLCDDDEGTKKLKYSLKSIVEILGLSFLLYVKKWSWTTPIALMYANLNIKSATAYQSDEYVIIVLL